MRPLRVLLLAGCGVALAACSSQRDLVVLLPGEDGRTGALVVTRDGDSRVLDAPLAAAAASPDEGVRAVTLDQAELDRRFGAAIAATPPAVLSFTLYFEEGTTRLTEASRPALGALLAEVRSRRAPEVQVTGHTDRVGLQEDNDRLSRARAERVREALVEQGLDPAIARTAGRGEREPLVATADGVEEPRNRRVEVIVR